MGRAGGWLIMGEDYHKENKKTRPRVTPIKKKKEPEIKIRKGNFKAEFVKAGELKHG